MRPLMHRLTLVWVWAVCAVAGHALADPPSDAKSAQSAGSSDRIAPDVIRRHVEYLASPALEGRGARRGKRLAAEYIRRRFEELKLQPLFGDGGFFQEVPGPRTKQGQETIAGRNIGAFLTGSDPALRDEFIIVSAHYDHLGIRNGKIYPGADDNAGSVAMLLEVARQFVEGSIRPKRTMVFLSCDLEENMLWGSRWFAAHPPWSLERVKLFVTAEMIGRTLGDLPLGTIFVLGSEHARGLKQIVDGAECAPELKVAHLGIDLIGTRSDYGPFRDEKVPFLFFSGGEHPDYHKPTDTADRLDYARAARVSQLIFDTCRRVADAAEPPQWTDDPERGLDEVRTLHRITELLLAADEAVDSAGTPKLNSVQRFTVSNVHTRTARIIERGEVLADERPWLVRSAQVLLLTVF